MSDPTPPQPPDPSRPPEPDEPAPEGASSAAADPADGTEEADAEPYDAASESGPVYEAREPGGDADRNWQVACHLVSLAWILGMPLVHLLGPLAIWYFVKRDDEDVEHHAKEAFNFQVNMLLWIFLGGLMIPTCLLTPVGLVLLGGGLVAAAVLPIVAAVKTSEGVRYRYPLTFRFLD